MKDFFCNKKATVSVFFAHPKPKRIEVYLHKEDGKNMLYFFRDLDGQDRLKFNIAHPGRYSVNVDCDTIEVLPLSIHPLKINMPPYQRNAFPKKSEIVFNPNLEHTPARNFWKKGIIEVGKKFYKQPFPIREFILLHEEGHYFYKDEELADLYAAQKYISQGYNNSMAYHALTDVLNFESNTNKKRIHNLFTQLHR